MNYQPQIENGLYYLTPALGLWIAKVIKEDDAGDGVLINVDTSFIVYRPKGRPSFGVQVATPEPIVEMPQPNPELMWYREFPKGGIMVLGFPTCLLKLLMQYTTRVNDQIAEAFKEYK